MNSDAIGEITELPYSDLQRNSDILMGPEGPTLIGTQCSSCLSLMSGSRRVCSSCVGQDLAQVSLGPRGLLYSHTTIHVSPSSAEPHTLGYVDLEQGVRILASIRGDVQNLCCDLPVTLKTDGDAWFFVQSAEVSSNGDLKD